MHADELRERRSVSQQSDFRVVDEQLMIERALQNRADFEPIYLRYADAIYRMCLRATGDPDLADDLTAKVFLTVLERLHTYQQRPGGTFRSWLFVVAKNTMRDHWRRTNRVHAWGDDRQEPVDTSPGPDTIAIHRMELDELRAVLATLNERYRTIIEFRLSGLTTQEIAEAMGVTVSSLKSAQTRAYALIRQEFDHNGGPR